MLFVVFMGFSNSCDGRGLGPIGSWLGQREAAAQFEARARVVIWSYERFLFIFLSYGPF